MVIIDEKLEHMLPPPPSYSASTNVPISPPPFPGHQIARDAAALSKLPPHILLYIVHQTLPQSGCSRGGDSKVERQRKVLYWMAISLRLVSRTLYIACMHVLRSTYLSAYTALVHPLYSSDPFPMSAPSPASNSRLMSPVNSLQRETAVLDLFISVKVREDVWLDDSELHLERDEAFQDLFDLMQPRARLEDLVREYGRQAGIISSTTPSGNAVISSECSPSASSFALASAPPSPFGACSKGASRKKALRKLSFASLSCSFSPRSAGIVYTTRGGKRTIVEAQRSRDEKLEVTAKRLVKELSRWIEENC